MSLFKKAAQVKLRFNSARGNLFVEDLYDLPLTSRNGVSLDGIAKAVNKELKLSEEESFVSAPSSKDCINQLRLDILKDVIADRIDANEVAKDSVAKAAKKQKLLEILSNKQDASLEGLTEDEIKAEIAKLG